ncbi:hypothetical protein HD554DRAFT_2096292 [Boletus coccyginus]|nr:hypothetical protein HD554DRAFT_2096292 [Boletus coccyginus]
MSTSRAVLCFWITLLAVAALGQFVIVKFPRLSDLFQLVISSPVPEPEPAPIDSKLASILSSNLNLGCQNGCPASSSEQELVSCRPFTRGMHDADR